MRMVYENPCPVVKSAEIMRKKTKEIIRSTFSKTIEEIEKCLNGDKDEK